MTFSLPLYPPNSRSLPPRGFFLKNNMGDKVSPASPQCITYTSSGKQVVVESPPPHKINAKEYAFTRFSTLKPPMQKAPNPVRLLMMLNTRQWLFFLCAFLAWACLSFTLLFSLPRSLAHFYLPF